MFAQKGVAILLCLIAWSHSGLVRAQDDAAPEKGQPVMLWTDPELAAEENPDFLTQGEYLITRGIARAGIQVVAQGGDEFRVLAFEGGLPGAGWNGAPARSLHKSAGELNDFLYDLRKVERKSSTSGKEAPGEALVLFAGKSTSYVKGEIDGELLWPEATIKAKVRDFFLHLEFRLPFDLSASESDETALPCGVKLFDHEAILIRDSFGVLQGESSQEELSVSIEGVKAPDAMMSFPPLAWQTLDIEYTAPVFEEEGGVSKAKVSVWHNGRLVHDGVELSGAAGVSAESSKGGHEGAILIREGDTPIAFRNLWLDRL